MACPAAVRPRPSSAPGPRLRRKCSPSHLGPARAPESCGWCWPRAGQFPTCSLTDTACGPGSRVDWRPADLSRPGQPTGPASVARGPVGELDTCGSPSSGPHSRTQRVQGTTQSTASTAISPGRYRPGTASTAWYRAPVARPSRWRAIRRSGPTKGPRVTARQTATCGTVSGPRGPARSAVRAAPTPARSGGRVRWRRRVPRPGRVVPGGAPRPGPQRRPGTVAEVAESVVGEVVVQRASTRWPRPGLLPLRPA
jgi:hypothetical protein